MKFILLLLLLAFACAAAMLLITRLNRIAAQLGDLKRDAVRKDDELARRVADFNANANAREQRGKQPSEQTRIEN